MLYTTLNKIRAHSPCADGWETLLKHLAKTGPDDEQLSIETILESNGILDALWCLRAVNGHDKDIRLFATGCARLAQHSLKDMRSVAAINVAERFAHGQADYMQLEAASDAASAAASGAALGAANAAASAAAWDATSAVAWDVTRAAAWDVTRAAAWGAAWCAARDAAWCAARDAAWSAIRDEFVKRFC